MQRSGGIGWFNWSMRGFWKPMKKKKKPARRSLEALSLRDPKFRPRRTPKRLRDSKKNESTLKRVEILENFESTLK